MKDKAQSHTYHNSFAFITVLGVDNVGDRISFHSQQSLCHDLSRILRRAYEDDISGAHLTEPDGQSLRKEEITGEIKGGEHAGTVGLQLLHYHFHSIVREERGLFVKTYESNGAEVCIGDVEGAEELCH